MTSRVLYIDQLVSEIKSWWELEFDETELDGIVNKILMSNVDSWENRQQHVQDIKRNAEMNQTD